MDEKRGTLVVHPQAGAFTLVELLVVIAIISVLAAMLMPVLEEALESANSIDCTNNLRQIGQANMGYASDHVNYPVPTLLTGFLWHNSLLGGDPDQLLLAGGAYEPGYGRLRKPLCLSFRCGSGKLSKPL